MARAPVLGFVAIVLVAGAASQWWSHRQEQNLGTRLAASAAPGDLRMLASDTCAICASARSWLQAHQVPYTECSIERDAACAAEFAALRSPGTPVFVVRGVPELGFNPRRLLERLES